MNVLILVVGLTLFISAICSLFEATLYSTRLSTLESARRRGDHAHRASQFIRMKREISTPTSAILILNTVANTAGASIAGMYAGQLFGLSLVPFFSLGLTVGILFFSEILPKTYGATRWPSIWPYVVWPLLGMQKILLPAIWATQGFSRFLTRGWEFPAVTEEEVRATIRLGAESGEITPSERRLLSAIFHFDELRCRQVMVPRQDVIYFEAGWSIQRCLEVARRTRHTRYPVCEGGLDVTVGLVHIKDLVGVPSDPPFDLRSVLRPLEHVPETAPLPQLLRRMQGSQQHMALVIDEHGGTVGVITLEIVLEQIVGSLQDEFDAEPPEIVREKRDQVVVFGHLPIARINRELHLSLGAPQVDTLSGLLMSRLGRLLRKGDTVDLEGAEAEVLEVSKGRGTRIRLKLEKTLETRDGETDPGTFHGG